MLRAFWNSLPVVFSAKAASDGGRSMIFAGLLFHYLIAGIFAAFSSGYIRRFKSLKNWLATAFVYGIFVWCVMNLAVVPFRVVSRPINISNALINTGILIICIGIRFLISPMRITGNCSEYPGMIGGYALIIHGGNYSFFQSAGESFWGERSTPDDSRYVQSHHVDFCINCHISYLKSLPRASDPVTVQSVGSGSPHPSMFWSVIFPSLFRKAPADVQSYSGQGIQ